MFCYKVKLSFMLEILWEFFTTEEKILLHMIFINDVRRVKDHKV